MTFFTVLTFTIELQIVARALPSRILIFDVLTFFHKFSAWGMGVARVECPAATPKAGARAKVMTYLRGYVLYARWAMLTECVFLSDIVIS